MARKYMSAALMMVVGMTGLMFGCENSGTYQSGVRSTYGNIEIIDDWNKAPAPAPRPVAAAPAKPAPAPAPAPAKPAPAPAPAPMMAGNCMFLPTGDKASSALSLCCKMPSEVVAGQNFTYDIEVCNLTNMTLSNVNVSYTLDGARVVSSDPTAGSGGFIVGDLAPRACKTIKITANAAGVGTVKACMGATWMNALCCGTNVVQPALRIVKDVTPKEITPCDNVTYTITVTNTGTGAASNVKIMDDLPAGVTSDGKSSLAWDLGTLGAGQSQTRTFSAKAGKTGSYVNHAKTAADGGLSATSNDVSITVRQPALSVTKDCAAMVSGIGRPATFKITVTNTGDAPATNVVVEDTLASGQVVTSASDGGVSSGGVVRWNLGTLAPRASKELTLSCTLAGTGEFCDTVRATCTCAEPATAKCCTKVTGLPDMRTSLDDTEGVVPVGANHVITYSVGNQGQITLTNVTCKITLPAGMQFVSADSSVSAPVVNGQVQVYNLRDLAPGQNKTFKFTVKGTQVGEMLVISETTCAEMKTSVRDDEVTNFVAP